MSRADGKQTSTEQDASAVSREQPAKKPKRRNSPYSLLFRILHWILPLSLAVLFVTGLSLHWAASPDWTPLIRGFPPSFLEGQVNAIHMIAALVFVPSTMATTWLYFARYRQHGRWGTRRVINVALVVLSVVLVLTGLHLRHVVGPIGLLSASRWTHALLGLFLVPLVFLAHTIFGLWRHLPLLTHVFKPWGGSIAIHGTIFGLVTVASVLLLLNGPPAISSFSQLTAKRIASVGDDMTALPWDDAEPLEIPLANGIGFDRGCTTVRLKAMHDGNELFVFAQWADPKEDRRYMPWERTEDGWKYLISIRGDESVFYEDKFSLIFPAEPNPVFERIGCSVNCHLGGGHPYGYKTSERIIDVWHWKSTRTDPIGQVDDKYWLGDDLELKDVGRHGDPKDGGSYMKNKTEDEKHPAFLPSGPNSIKQGALLREHAVAYNEELAKDIPVGEIIPGIVIAPAKGDRGDVSCVSHYKDGMWHLYIRRKLDTGSKYDAKFVPGGRIAFGCAAFDHSGKRHAYNHNVNYLVLEK